jgi:penicillin-binding protein 1A
VKVLKVVLTNIGRLIRLALIVGAGLVTLTTAIAVAAPRIAEIAGSHRFERAGISLETLSERSYVYDRNGALLATFVAEENRVQVGLEDVPRTVVDSVLAAEDSAFYSHQGVNARSIGRALTANIESGGVAQGGSTITQQVVKNTIDEDDQDFARKVREAVLAVELEEDYTKDEILEHYVNTVYFGAGAYGVQAAAETYFRKDVGELSWAEGAMLASIIRCPGSCDPFKSRSRASNRRNTVLDALVITGRLGRTEADLNKLVPLPTEAFEPRQPNDYFVEEVKQRLLDDERLGSTPTARYNRLYGGGLRVYTTFDQRQHLLAVQARNDNLPVSTGDGTFALPPDPLTGLTRFGTAAMAGVEPGTGAVRFLVGGPGFDRYQFDLSQQSNRQVGSTFKTFVLTAAILNGATPNDTVDGRGPCRGIPGYEKEEEPPGNFGGARGGTDTLTEQTLRSSNCSFLRLNQIVGPEKVAEVARSMGVTADLSPENGSMALGTDGISPLEMAAAYSVLANDGMRNPTYFIDRVEEADGDVVFAHRAEPERVLPTEVARQVTSVLEKNVERGTGTRAAIASGQPAAGKTGTTNNAYDVWFVGYTPQLATSVWIGATGGNVRLSFGGGGDLQGGRAPAQMWGAFMSAVTADQPIVEFTPPEPPARSQRLCFESGFRRCTDPSPLRGR